MGACCSLSKLKQIAGVEREDELPTTFASNLVGADSPERFHQQYDEGEVLGEGITGTVKIVKRKETGEEFAMKTINLSRIDKAQLEELNNEIRILRALDHPNVVRLLNTFSDKTHIYMIMELCKGGDLSKNRLKTENEVRRVVSQILKACSYCHSQGVVHRDLKLENVILSNTEHDSDVKVIDFGLSATFHTESTYTAGKGAGVMGGGLGSSQNKGSNRAKRSIKHNKAKRMFLTTCGTAYYMAPEVIEGAYTEACDLWAIGVITFMLLTGRPPFDGRDEDEVFDKIEAGKVPFTSPVWQQVGGQARSFVQHLLMVDPRRRWSADQALKSPWLTEFFESERRKSASDTRSVALENEIIESLERFSKYTQLRKAALMVVAHHVAQGDVNDLKNMFLEIDVEQTGYITVDELEAVLKRHGKADLAHVREVFMSIDQDRTGRVRYLEFLAATIETRCVVDATRLGAAFDHLDEDSSGYVTVSNLRKLLGKGFSTHEVNRIVKESDLTGDGRVSREEFLRIMGEGQPSPFKPQHVVGEDEKSTAVAEASEVEMKQTGQANTDDVSVVVSLGSVQPTSGGEAAAVKVDVDGDEEGVQVRPKVEADMASSTTTLMEEEEGVEGVEAAVTVT